MRITQANNETAISKVSEPSGKRVKARKRAPAHPLAQAHPKGSTEQVAQLHGPQNYPMSILVQCCGLYPCTFLAGKLKVELETVHCF